MRWNVTAYWDAPRAAAAACSPTWTRRLAILHFLGDKPCGPSAALPAWRRPVLPRAGPHRLAGLEP